MSMKILISVMTFGAILSGAAMAQDTVESTMPNILHARYSDCQKMEKNFTLQVKNTQTGSNETALKTAHQAAQFCALAQYPEGVALYLRASQQLPTQ